jgi:hypothetical protein
MYVEKAAPTIISSSGRVQFRSATERKLTDRPLDVKCNARHFREQIDIGDFDSASAEPHVGRHVHSAEPRRW